MKSIILNEFRSQIRNSFTVLIFILFPIAMIYVLGNMVENVQVADTTIGNVSIGYTMDENSINMLQSMKQVTMEPMTKKGS